jgi:hypothetical protein
MPAILGRKRIDRGRNPATPSTTPIVRRLLLTHGLENASREFEPKQIHSMVAHQREKYVSDCKAMK